jgi:tetratricopeptide (TPR) repeat protein
VRRSLLFSVVIATFAGVALLWSGDSPTRAAGPAVGDDIGALVDQLSAQSSRDVVRRLEMRVARGPSARSLALLGLGYQQLFRETGDPSWLRRADEALNRSIATGARDTLALTGLAQLAVTRHRFRAAIPLAREVLRRESENAAAHAALGDALFNRGSYEGAFAVYDRLAELGPSVGGYARVAFARRLLGRPADALEAIELALEAGSGIPEQAAWAEVQHGALLLAEGRVGRAEGAYRRALRLVPGYIHARAGLARVDAARGRFGPAARRLEEVVAVLPAPEYAILLGDAWSRAGGRRRASQAYGTVAVLERLLAASGVRTELQTALFDLDRGHHVGDALRRARAAYAAAPSVAAADAVAWGLARNGRCAEARGWSRRALRFGTRDGLFLFHRGVIERCLGRGAEGRRWMREALAADPNFSLRWAPAARAALGRQGHHGGQL